MSRSRITLADLNQMKGAVSIRRLAIACEMNETTLRHRLRRMEPDLTFEESERIKRVLSEMGLQPIESSFESGVGPPMSDPVAVAIDRQGSIDMEITRFLRERIEMHGEAFEKLTSAELIKRHSDILDAHPEIRVNVRYGHPEYAVRVMQIKRVQQMLGVLQLPETLDQRLTYRLVFGMRIQDGMANGYFRLQYRGGKTTWLDISERKFEGDDLRAYEARCYNWLLMKHPVALELLTFDYRYETMPS